MIRRAAPLALAASLLFAPFAGAGAGAAAQAPGLALGVDAGAPRLLVRDVLDDDRLEQALRSGLPVRMNFRVELWRDRLFDQLVQHAEWTTVIGYEPLRDRFVLRLTPDDTTRSYAAWSAVREVIEGAHAPPLRPPGPGSFYYLANLEIETLSLSDLEELAHWLRGELGPAVTGDRSVAGALGRGARRALIRLLDLPARRYTARSGVFTL